jgi:hypothetical protein
VSSSGKIRGISAARNGKMAIYAACLPTCLCEGLRGSKQSNPMYPHGLLHSVRNDGGSYCYRHDKELRGTKHSIPVYTHGLLHCVRNDDECYSYHHDKESRGVARYEA